MTCYLVKSKLLGPVFMCGEDLDFGPHCAAECMDISEYLCDYPVGEGKTCDMPLCGGHAYEVAPELHYCPGHTTMWKEFKDSGGVKRVLENVVPFKSP